ncbi:MAG: hypothetical protein HF967_08220, partial [Methanosarcinales archaeon]|nr:hypothetical protein [Methanosarcinales archaeon]
MSEINTSKPKQIIDEIRKIKFGIGVDTTNLPEIQKKRNEESDKTLNNFSKIAKEIQTKNDHFIFELIQNAEDNEYEKSKPTIKFIINFDSLIIQNNEKGFYEENVKALCNIGGSSKIKKGYIGEKGIGFKSVFMVANKVQIYSNGFQFQFWHHKDNTLWKKFENTTMIIPEWIEKSPDFIDLKQTNFILYLKPETNEKISKYIEKIQPLLLLFLKKLKVIEIEDKNKNKIRRLGLNKREGIVEIFDDDEKNYWKVIKKSFNAPQNIGGERRKDVNETEIVLAFTLKDDYTSNTSNDQFIFAFLPIKKYGFKFLIHADFILSISREDILKDNKWNVWIRDSIIEVFLDAIIEFKKDEKLKYNFYDYLSFDEVKDEFFLPIVEQIFEKLKEEECILTSEDRWKKPSKILVGNEEIKKIVTNEDLQKFFEKEYISERVKAKKPILIKLGVEYFLIKDLIKCLENTEWIKKQNDEWFVSLFSYFSKEKLSDEQLNQLKHTKIIKIESEELTSINGYKVFIPLEKKETYGFEHELNVIKKDIIDAIYECEKEEKDGISEF